MKVLTALALPLGLVTLPIISNLELAPQNFDDNTFVDFHQARYEITYDAQSRKANFKATITFEQESEGRPIFDMVEDPKHVKVNGRSVNVQEISDPNMATKMRVAMAHLSPGQHELEVIGAIRTNLKFSNNSVKSAFWMSDLTDRKYLEQYLPTNMEYDQYAMTMQVKILNTDTEHEVFANGEIEKTARNSFNITYPEYFTASSLFFHLTEKDDFNKKTFEFTSINGAVIPIIAYSRSNYNLWGIQDKVEDILNELESKLGAWSHPGLTIYIAGLGGMEYSGATMTSMRALGHEITHSYFARGVMPTNGNSGWIDEAIASWRDDGYQSHSSLQYSSAKMSGFSIYQRTTDRKAYNEGAKFMAYLNGQLDSQGGLEVFLAHIYKKYNHKSLTTELFRSELEAFSGLDFKREFKSHIYGSGASKSYKRTAPNPYHPQLSKKELLDLL